MFFFLCYFISLCLLYSIYAYYFCEICNLYLLLYMPPSVLLFFLSVLVLLLCLLLLLLLSQTFTLLFCITDNTLIGYLEHLYQNSKQFTLSVDLYSHLEFQSTQGE